MKFDDNAGKHGYDRIKDKVVRIVVNDSLDEILSVSSICCGIFIEKDNNRYKALCIDEQMKINSIDNIEISCDKNISSEATIIENEIKKIISLFSIAQKIVYTVNNNNAICWNNLVWALEPLCHMTS